jgi:hypothetical protein
MTSLLLVETIILVPIWQMGHLGCYGPLCWTAATPNEASNNVVSVLESAWVSVEIPGPANTW